MQSILRDKMYINLFLYYWPLLSSLMKLPKLQYIPKPKILDKGYPSAVI